MKKIRKIAVCCMLLLFVGVSFACGDNADKILLGKYSETTQAFTEISSEAGYYIEVNETTITLKGEIPYSDGILGLEAGNIVAIKIQPNIQYLLDNQTYIKTTNKNATGGYNVYDKSAIEEDGSIIWVTAVNKTSNVELKVKWNSDAEETTYVLKVDESATLKTA